MKSVLISIKPKWCEKIASGRKTIEVRKSAPKEVPFKAYIYATKPKKFYKCGAISTSDELLWFVNGKVEIGDGFKFWADGDEYQGLNGRVIGEFICDKVYMSFVGYMKDEPCYWDILNGSCLTKDEIMNYGEWATLYGWHISDLVIYDKPKELSEFGRKCDYASEIHCRDCLILGDWDSCCGVMCKPLTRPPQSYMYIEEI